MVGQTQEVLWASSLIEQASASANQHAFSSPSLNPSRTMESLVRSQTLNRESVGRRVPAALIGLKVSAIEFLLQNVLLAPGLILPDANTHSLCRGRRSPYSDLSFSFPSTWNDLSALLTGSVPETGERKTNHRPLRGVLTSGRRQDHKSCRKETPRRKLRGIGAVIETAFRASASCYHSPSQGLSHLQLRWMSCFPRLEYEYIAVDSFQTYCESRDWFAKKQQNFHLQRLGLPWSACLTRPAQGRARAIPRNAWPRTHHQPSSAIYHGATWLIGPIRQSRANPSPASSLGQSRPPPALPIPQAQAPQPAVPPSTLRHPDSH